MSDGFSLPGRGRGRFKGQQTAKPGLPPASTNDNWGNTAVSTNATDDGWGTSHTSPAATDNSGWNNDPWGTTTGSSDANNNAADPWSKTNSNSGGGGGGDPWGSSGGDNGGDPWGSGGGGGGGYGSSNAGGGGGGGRSRGCYICSEEGHMSRDCPTKGSGGGGGGGARRGCYNCGEEGHQSRDCPNPKQERAMKCYNCQGEGHQSRDCPNPRQEREPRSQKCYNCQQDGHTSRDCPNPKQEREPRSQKCYNCNGEGHQSRDCTEPQRERSNKCFNCQQDGHMSKDCPNEAAPRTGADGKALAPVYVAPEISDDPSVLFDSLSVGINFDRYDSIPVEVDDTRFRKPMNSFEEMGFCMTIRNNVQRMNFTKPTPVQKYAVPIVLKGMDLMACAQTGSGKTAAFMLPIMHKLLSDPDLPNPSWQECQEPLAVVLAPTRELAIQIATDAKRMSYDSILKIVLVYGGTAVKAQMNQLCRGCHILVGTTGRLKDFLNRGALNFSSLRFLVLDEADRMLDMGFEPDVRAIVGHSSMPAKGQRQTLMFSATFPPTIQQLAREFLADNVRLSVGILGSANQDVRQTFIKVDRRQKRDKLIEILRAEGSDARIMVFVEMKKTADFLAAYISQVGLKTTSIHGDRFQSQREEALNDFRAGRCPVIIATAVAARGLDIKGVSHVINYDLPKQIDEYVHRVGRTGRVGNTGLSTSFYDSSTDRELLSDLIKILGDSQQEVPQWMQDDLHGGGSMDMGGAGGDDWNGGGGSSNGYGNAQAEEEAWQI